MYDGERVYVGHKQAVHIDQLMNVPWCVIDGERRTIESSSASQSENIEESKIEERLEALGYR